MAAHGNCQSGSLIIESRRKQEKSALRDLLAHRSQLHRLAQYNASVPVAGFVTAVHTCLRLSDVLKSRDTSESVSKLTLSMPVGGS
jgi:hypothetical protein